MLYYFLKQLSTKWIALLGFMPALYDFLSVYFEWNLKLPIWVTIVFVIGAFFYASYKVFEDEYKKRKDLEKILDGPTSYEITAILIPINFQLEKDYAYIDEIKNKAIQKLKEIKLIQEKSPTSNPGTVTISLESLGLANRLNKTHEEYNRELAVYKAKLEEIIENAESQKITLKETISQWQTQYYFIKFIIENTGIKSDTDIQIKITCSDESIIFERNKFVTYGLDIPNLLPSLPKEPEKPNLVHMLQAPSLFERAETFFPQITPLNALRKLIEIKDKKCSATLGDLHVGDEVDIFKRHLIIKTYVKMPEFNVTIKSKESTRVLHPIVKVKFLEIPIPLFEKEED